MIEVTKLFVEDCMERGMLKEALAECGFDLAGEKTKKRRKPVAALTGRVVNIPAEIPMAAYC